MRVERVMDKGLKAVGESPNTKDRHNGLLISCPACKKTFHRPLIMLDFDEGQAKLMHVCPYCSHIMRNGEPEISINFNGESEVVKYGKE